MGRGAAETDEGWLPSKPPPLPLCALPPPAAAAATAAATAPWAIRWLSVVFDSCCLLLLMWSGASDVGLQTRPLFNDLRNLSLLLLFSALGIIYHNHGLA